MQTDWTPAPEDYVSFVDVEYYLSTSATSLFWWIMVDDSATWVNGKYMWSRTVTTDGAGNRTYSPNQNGVCIAGAQGATGAKGDKGDTGGTGATGKGVKSIVEQYYNQRQQQPCPADRGARLILDGRTVNIFGRDQ